MIALIIHSQQTEATYRLDFIWKLQATGSYKKFQSSLPDLPTLSALMLSQKETSHHYHIQRFPVM